MTGKVESIKVCSPLKLYHGLQESATKSAITHTIYRWL